MFAFQFHQSLISRRARFNPVYLRRRVAQLHQNDAIFGKFPCWRSELNGRGGESHREGIDRVGHHSGRTSEENYEQCTEHSGANSRQW